MSDARTTIIAAAVGVITSFGTIYANKIWLDAEHSAANSLQFVEIALGILRAEPSDESRPLRSWAIDVINANSHVQIDKETRMSLISNTLVSEYVSRRSRYYG